MRSAMGAGRGRIARQLLTENILLAVAGGGLGLLFAFGGLDLLVGYAERFTRRAYEVEIDSNVLLFTALASLVTGLLFGTAPAVTERNSTALALTEGASTRPRRSRRLQNMLVVVQVSVAFTVLTGAGLMLRSLWELYQVDPGMDPQEVVALSVHLDRSSYKTTDEVNLFYEEVLARFLETPGVVAAVTAMDAPLGEPHSRLRHISEVDREGVLDGEERVVGLGYFGLVGARLLAGRAFTDQDSATSPGVTVVNETFAELMFPGDNVLGRSLRLCVPDGCWEPVTVVGVTSDISHDGPEFAVKPEVFLLDIQGEERGPFILLRIAGEEDKVLSLASQIVHSVDGNVPVTDVSTSTACSPNAWLGAD